MVKKKASFGTYIEAKVKKLDASTIKKLKTLARKKKKPVLIKVIKRQTGESIIAKDKKRSAMPPGKRISKSGKLYYEYRANRSDRNPKKRL